VPVGTWLVAAEHPALDTIGLSSFSARANVAAGRTSQITLAVPSLRTIARAACQRGAALAGRGSGVVFGAVLDADSGAHLAGAEVSPRWPVVSRIVGAGAPRARSARARAGEHASPGHELDCDRWKEPAR